MRQMIADGVKVQCIVTSPPYWGLRDYGTGTWKGGDAECDHLAPPVGETRNVGRDRAASNGKFHDAANPEPALAAQYAKVCGKCGARRVDNQFGLERTWERHVARMRGVFRLARQLLADDGVLWMNLGDSYAGTGGQSPQSGPLFKGRSRQRENICLSLRGKGTGLKPKDLIGMPWRIAFALQDDGWYLRSDVIWNKPNPMPESVTDRPTKSHEYLFLFAKSEIYHYDADAIAEPASSESHARSMRSRSNSHKYADGGPGNQTITKGKVSPGHIRKQDAGEQIKGGDRKSGFNERWRNRPDELLVRNVRTVWTIPTEAFPGAHFATFPQDLVRRCILAGSRPGDAILDLFMGSGTVAQCATDLGRNFIGCELNPAYVGLHSLRSTTIGMPF